MRVGTLHNEEPGPPLSAVVPAGAGGTVRLHCGPKTEAVSYR
jgi:hypothetical protein